MFDIFSDIFALRSNSLTRFDARLKMLAAIPCLLVVILSSRPFLPVAVTIASLLALRALRIPFKLILIRMAPPMATVLLLVLIQSLLSGSTPWLSFPLGHWHIVLKREGALHGALMGSRVLGAVSLAILFGVATPAHDLFRSLKWARLPGELVEVAMLMYRYIFTLIDQASDVAEAQKMRLGYLGVRRSLSSMGTLAGTVIIRSIDQATRTHEAMTLRGYSGAMPFEPMPPFVLRDTWIASFVALALILLYALQEWGLGR